MQNLFNFFLFVFLGDKEVAFKSSFDLYFDAMINEFF